MPEYLTGDFNKDFLVDAADYAVWRKGFGTIYTADDYNMWRSQFGRTPGSGAGVGFGAAEAMPEPTAVGLLVVAVLGALPGLRGSGNRRK